MGRQRGQGLAHPVQPLLQFRIDGKPSGQGGLQSQSRLQGKLPAAPVAAPLSPRPDRTQLGLGDGVIRTDHLNAASGAEPDQAAHRRNGSL